MIDSYNQLKSELNSELKNILNYWCTNTIDNQYGGFFGKIDHFNKVIPKASKGIILNTRILWSFSAVSNHFKTNEYRDLCDRSYQYLKTYFNDETYKGVYWDLNYLGEPKNKRKQVYAQAFAIYALSEYFIFSKNQEAKNWAVELFEQLEKHAKDNEKVGYFEAFDTNWEPIKDMRLSDKDMNASKTMNTHLHLLEAYTSLLSIYDNNKVRSSLKELVVIFLDKFLNEQNHYDLFFDEDWKKLSNTVSYGHNIETAWLLIEAAKKVGDKDLIEQTQRSALHIANTFLKDAIDADGAVMNEKNLNTGVLDTDRHWWPQVEALIGLNYTYKLNNDPKFIDHSLKIWEFIKKSLIDPINGEWYFRVDKNGKVYTEEDKVSMWKAPYHVTRACIKLINS